MGYKLGMPGVRFLVSQTNVGQVELYGKLVCELENERTDPTTLGELPSVGIYSGNGSLEAGKSVSPSSQIMTCIKDMRSVSCLTAKPIKG